MLLEMKRIFLVVFATVWAACASSSKTPAASVAFSASEFENKDGARILMLSKIPAEVIETRCVESTTGRRCAGQVGTTGR